MSHCSSGGGGVGEKTTQLTEGVEVGAVVPAGQQVREEVGREGVEGALEEELGPGPHLRCNIHTWRVHVQHSSQ